jgi:galactonate dehydratase
MASCCCQIRSVGYEGMAADGTRQRVKGHQKTMKITQLKTFLVPPRWLFLKIETDEGLCGWGEPVLEGRAQTVAAAVDELADYLVGKDPSPIEDHWNVLYRGGFYRGGGVHMSALAGIDQALWDLRGKALGQPVHRLLGGPVRETIRAYSWVGGDSPEDIAEEARDAAARGFTALKMNGTEELQYIDSFAKIDRVAKNVAAVQEAVGNDFGIAVDFHGRVHRPMVKPLLRELEPYRLMFVEEPRTQRTCRRAQGYRVAVQHPDCSWGTAVFALGLQACSSVRSRGHNSA